MLADSILTKRFKAKAIIIIVYLKNLFPISSKKKDIQKAMDFKIIRY